jgi:succinate dehydrogenase / fumarate reductase iron-sulfur subunit
MTDVPIFFGGFHPVTIELKTIDLSLRIWRQTGPNDPGAFHSYKSGPISTDISFLEMLDILNERLSLAGEEPVAFDHDCREGICGTCGAVVNGIPHGPVAGTTLCQLHMRHFQDGDTLVIEPFRARAFRLEKDLIVDRGALDRIIQAGGYVSVNTGSAPEANGIPVPQGKAEEAMNSAECIGCGACVAACPNGSAMLFTGAKVSQLALLPQGRPERARRALALVRAMDGLGFGNCSNERECEAACPKGISIRNIARLNREFLRASFVSEEK